jgi:hypothetical protein
MDNLRKIADLLNALTYREMQDITSYLTNCGLGCEDKDGNPKPPDETDFAEYLLGWAEGDE